MKLDKNMEQLLIASGLGDEELDALRAELAARRAEYRDRQRCHVKSKPLWWSLRDQNSTYKVTCKSCGRRFYAQDRCPYCGRRSDARQIVEVIPELR